MSWECERQRFRGDDGAASLHTILKEHGSKLDREALAELVGDRPSLLTLTEASNRLGLPASGGRGDYEALQQIELPALTQPGEGSAARFAVVHEVDKDGVCLCDPRVGEVNLSREAYEAATTGVYGLFEAPVRSLGLTRGDQARRALTGVHMAAALLGAGLATLLALALEETSGAVLGLAGALGFGAVVSYLLSDAVLGAAKGRSVGGLVASVCRFGKTLSCGDVLSSPHGKLLGALPYAYVGLGFYAGGLVALTVAAMAGGPFLAGFLALAVVGLGCSLALAVRLVYVQARVLRRYCPWCMALHAANVVAFGLALTALGASPVLVAPTVVLALVWCLASLTAFGAFQVRELASRALETQRELSSLRQDPRVVRLAYDQAPEVERLSGGSADRRWSIGPARPDLDLDVAVHPLCHACAETDGVLQGFLAERGGVRQVVRLLTLDPPAQAPADLLEGATTPLKLNGILYAVGARFGPERFLQALGQVLGLQRSLAKAPVAQVLEAVGVTAQDLVPHVIAGWRRLCHDASTLATAEVSVTPTIHANGRRLPQWAALDQRMELLAGLHAEGRKGFPSRAKPDPSPSSVGNSLSDPWL